MARTSLCSSIFMQGGWLENALLHSSFFFHSLCSPRAFSNYYLFQLLDKIKSIKLAEAITSAAQINFALKVIPEGKDKFAFHFFFKSEV